MILRPKEELWVTWKVAMETLEEVEEFEDLTATHLMATNLETFEEFKDLIDTKLTTLNLYTLQGIEELTTTVLAALNLVLQTHAWGVERQQVVTKEELKRHDKVDAEDVAKLKKVDKKIPSTRRQAQGGGCGGHDEAEEGELCGSKHEATGTRRPDVEDRGLG